MVIDLEEDDVLEGEIEVSPSQLPRIANIDETNISLDGSNNGNTVDGLQLSLPTPDTSIQEKPSVRLGKGSP
jgi:DNA-directed RNA polymerase subunit H (RpoH/RPB5)